MALCRARIKEDLALAAVGDLVAPSLERLAKDRGETHAHEVERSEHVDRAHVGRRGVLGREREPPSERPGDPGVAEDEMRFGERTDGSGLPEGASGIRGRAVGIDRPLPVADEVVEPAIFALHVEDEVDETARPFAQAPIPRVTVEVQKEHDRTRRVVDARDALEASVARSKTHIFVVRVDADNDRVPICRRNTMRQARELSDHRDDGQGSRLARISLTEKSAAAMTESAAP